MFDIEREERILEILKEKKTVGVNTLSKELFYSPATIRRDLVRMEKKGLVIRTFGAVTINSTSNAAEIPFELREKSSLNEKRNLAQKVSQLLESNSTVFIDSSTTMFYIVPFLKEIRNLLIITNSLRLANEILIQTKHEVIIIGGNIQRNTSSVLGTFAQEQVAQLHADYALLSCHGFNIETGFSEASVDSALMKKVMAKNSKHTIVAFDSSKIGKCGAFKSYDVSMVSTVVCDKDIGEKIVKYFEEKNINVRD